MSIQLVDTGVWTHRHSEMLKQDTLAKVKQQKACIYAWCYSLFTFCEAPYEKMDKEYDEATKILRVNASGELKRPSKWDKRLGASFEEEQEAYKTAKLIEQKKVARQNREIASYADRKIFSITGEYWRWA